MRIVVAEDSVLFREGLVRLLVERGHRVVATAGHAVDLIAAVVEHRPDLAVVDIRMPPGDGADGARAARRIRAEHPEVTVLLLSQHIELRDCLNLVGTPGFGYLLKDRVLHLDEFDEAPTRVAAGGVALDPVVVQALVRGRTVPGALAALSAREHQVLALAAEGHSNTAVAGMLHLSERTVEAHMRSVFTKLNLYDDGSTNRRVQAVVAYLEAGPSP
ncbi:MAG TPA: response regulator transcription factor [Segeticoccus sp.]|uniref:response regulator transcription factor n=1 Tax=Segeticoccus sp. TaxID=2706531 RepID=UPI002D7FABB4|nr:response regulator transcription factor [Segeticoccus sp.]HET8600853.1 response regulator transcription factor [Segeticoccus sp.]